MFMMTSSNGNIFRVTGPLCGNSPVPVNSPHKGQWRGALMFSLIRVWINDWVNNREAGDLRRHRGHYDVNVMSFLVTAFLYTIVCFIWRRCKGTQLCYVYRYSSENCIGSVAITVNTFMPITKCPPFLRRHFPMHFLERKCVNIA